MQAIGRFHLANTSGRSAMTRLLSLRKVTPKYFVIAPDGSRAESQRYAIRTSPPPADASAIIDMKDLDDNLGMPVVSARRVYVDKAGKPLDYVRIFEDVFDVKGTLIDTREYRKTVGNIADPALPVVMTGKFIDVRKAVTSFVLSRTYQIGHVDGLTFDFLRDIAESIQGKGLAILGAGPGGKQPLYLKNGASAFRGFLSGTADKDSYVLLLHLSNMELKKPSP